jgi:hypothetical protein
MLQIMILGKNFILFHIFANNPVRQCQTLHCEGQRIHSLGIGSRTGEVMKVFKSNFVQLCNYSYYSSRFLNSRLLKNFFLAIIISINIVEITCSITTTFSTDLNVILREVITS